ncbi:MAG: radical SAM protein [Candidatus Omnitrophota bacterium]
MTANGFSYNDALRVKNILEADSSFRKRRARAGSMPVELIVNDTLRCNLRCVMCPLPKTRRYADMDFRLFRKIAAEGFPYAAEVTLSVAGEPFMNRNFFRQLDLIEQYKVTLSLFSNATLLPQDKKLLRVIKNLGTLFVSVDAATQKTYERIRRGGSFKNVINNIQRFNACRSALPVRGRPLLIFWLVLMRSNVEELDSYIQLALRLGADGIGFSHATISENKIRKESLVFHKGLANAQLALAKQALASCGLRIWAFPPPFSSVQNKKIAVSLKPCRFAWERAVIELNGDVYPCCAPNREGLLMGNVNTQCMRDIWNGSRYQSLRRSFKTGRLYSPCLHCYQRLKEMTSDDESIYVNSRIENA